MFATPERALATQKAAFDALLAAQNTAFAGFEKLVDLHLKVTKATFEEASLKAQEAFSLKDGQEALAFVSALAQPNAEKALAYSKHVYDIVSGVQNEFARLGEAQVAEQQRQLSDVVEQLAKNAPAGSESALALLKSSLATATSAYDSVNKAAKQAAELAESNLTAAANATFKAAAETGKTTRARKTAA
ncbi:phasin family protein [Pigmentiphaga sp.]|uniref:phasin family protein n=1 Tax=Pigmentiphaga sp. TaxID=1977564 RepID=UPI00128DCD11|nr:phasin family protein [Pigmentiphaga sp.]MPS30708.1 phasin family protein [Alcaligenaceae bacterium SAGV5]MPS52838.1 phasin family protein [Alcaligenaceae bacterium SAGV3]MPT60431.1 phasin family protein [Alcaligenaceae bacterium]